MRERESKREREKERERERDFVSKGAELVLITNSLPQ
jgi:hypothetical protein